MTSNNCNNVVSPVLLLYSDTPGAVFRLEAAKYCTVPIWHNQSKRKINIRTLK